MELDTTSSWIIELYEEMQQQLLHLQLTNPKKYNYILERQNQFQELNDNEEQPVLLQNLVVKSSTGSLEFTNPNEQST